jgi:hypothetical protein
MFPEVAGHSDVSLHILVSEALSQIVMPAEAGIQAFRFWIPNPLSRVLNIAGMTYLGSLAVRIARPALRSDRICNTSIKKY